MFEGMFHYFQFRRRTKVTESLGGGKHPRTRRQVQLGKVQFRLVLKEGGDRVSWRALTELIAPDGRVVLEEEQTVTVCAPETDSYRIDFDLLLRAKERDVTFGQFPVGGLAVRMPWEQAGPPHTHLNATGETGRACDQKRAAWCTVERPFGEETFGIALFDHPGNANHPAGWRVDQQGLTNPAVSLLGDWSLAAGRERAYRYGILVYRGPGRAEALERSFKTYAITAGLGSKK